MVESFCCVTYVFKARVETLTAGNSRYSFKVWEQGEPEPSNWELTIEEGLEDPRFGSMLLLAHHVSATFGNVQIVPLAFQPPSLKTVPKSYVEPDMESIKQVPAFAMKR